MISAGLFIMIGGIIGFGIFSFLAVKSFTRWGEERNKLTHVGATEHDVGEVVEVCPVCGRVPGDGMKYCENCGSKLR